MNPSGVDPSAAANQSAIDQQQMAQTALQQAHDQALFTEFMDAVDTIKADAQKQ
jgi:hypothetical protein